MDFFSNLAIGFSGIASFQTIAMIFFGTFMGIIIGALPGLTATTGVSIFLPMTFFMPPLPGMGFLLGIYCGGIYGGSITAILIKTPGTPAAAATVIDGFPLAQNSKALKALQMALYASTIGGLVSCGLLLFIAPPLARVAIKFGPSEYFAIGLFGLTIVATLSSGNMVKGLIAACLGLFLSFVGLDPVNGVARFTFGTVSLQSGFSTIPALIGLFAMSEIFVQTELAVQNMKSEKALDVRGAGLSWNEFRTSIKTIFKSSFIGSFIGVVPATGAAVAAFASYNEAKRSSPRCEEFGKGSLEGVAACEAANNAVTGSAMIPLLTLGVPGDSVTAVLLGALTVQGLTPGPLLFQKEKAVVFGIFAAMIVANIAMFALGSFGIRFFHKVTSIPTLILQPIIFALCCIGTYAASTSVFDVVSMLGFGLAGYFMIKMGIPVAPALLALILGPMIEKNLRRGLVSFGGSASAFLFRPITMFILVLALFSLCFCMYREHKARSEALKSHGMAEEKTEALD